MPKERRPLAGQQRGPDADALAGRMEWRQFAHSIGLGVAVTMLGVAPAHHSHKSPFFSEGEPKENVVPEHSPTSRSPLKTPRSSSSTTKRA
jgi:hypothetical protein